MFTAFFYSDFFPTNSNPEWCPRCTRMNEIHSNIQCHDLRPPLPAPCSTLATHCTVSPLRYPGGHQSPPSPGCTPNPNFPKVQCPIHVWRQSKAHLYLHLPRVFYPSSTAQVSHQCDVPYYGALVFILWPAKPTDYFSHSSYTYPHYTPLPVLRDLHIAPPDHGVLQLHPCGQAQRQQVGQGIQKDQFTTSVMPRIYGTINIIFYHFLFSQYV